MKSPMQRQLELFSAALEHPPGPERDEFVTQACGGDETLRRYVQGLLAGHEKAGAFLDKPAGPVGREERIWCILMGFFGGGRHLVADWTNSVSVWTPETGARVDIATPNNMPTLNGITTKTCDVKPDEPLYALGCVDGSMELRNLSSGAKVAAWPAHDESVGAVAYSRDGKRLATGSIKGEVKIWDSTHRREVTRIGPVDQHIMCLTFSADGKWLAGSGVSDRVWVWDVETGRQLLELGGHGNEYVGAVAFSPDGKLLATTTVSANEARLWELPSGRQIATLKGHVQGLTGVEFSPDGKTLTTVSYDRKVKLWSVSTQQELVTFPFNTAWQAVAARFTPDGRALAISYLDARGSHTRLVRAPSFEEIAAAEGGRTETWDSSR